MSCFQTVSFNFNQIKTEYYSVSIISYYGSCSNCAVTTGYGNDTSTATAADGVGVLEAAVADIEQ